MAGAGFYITQRKGKDAAKETLLLLRFLKRNEGQRNGGSRLPLKLSPTLGSAPFGGLRRSRTNSLSKQEPPVNETSISNGWKYFVHSAAPSVPLCRGRGLQAKAGTKRPSVAPVFTEKFK